jgi:hypothetical protein
MQTSAAPFSSYSRVLADKWAVPLHWVDGCWWDRRSEYLADMLTSACGSVDELVYDLVCLNVAARLKGAGQ